MLWNLVRMLFGYPPYPRDWGDKDYHVYSVLRQAGFNAEDAIERTNTDRGAREKLGKYYEAMFPRTI